MNIQSSTLHRCDPGAPPVFDLFPYLLTYIGSEIGHIIHLPLHDDWPPERLFHFCGRQTEANRLHTWLVLEHDKAWHFHPEGQVVRSPLLPPVRIIAHDELQSCEQIEPYPDLLATRNALKWFADQLHRTAGNVILMGDLTKGGRLPREGEEDSLRGCQPNGVPAGLELCALCGEWRGECFDTLNKALIVRVHCRCENHNRCARCGEPLHARRLNGNHFSPDDGKIWHTPAFCALQHRCADLPAAQASSEFSFIPAVQKGGRHE